MHSLFCLPRRTAPMLFFLLLAGWSVQGTAAQAQLIGSNAPVFALISSEDRLVDYQHDYYGRHHLILTFFPAAFTPV